MTSSNEKVTIGWREWVVIEQFEQREILAKIDTGAEYSALHALDLQIVKDKATNTYQAKFRIHEKEPLVKLEINKFIKVKSSNGESQLRPAVTLKVLFAGGSYLIDTTLTDRTPMNYDMLIGRKALAGKFVVDCEKNKMHPKPTSKEKM